MRRALSWLFTAFVVLSMTGCYRSQPAPPPRDEPLATKPAPNDNGQRVAVVTDDQVNITGTLRISSGKRRPTILLLHGYGGSRHDWKTFADAAEKAGFNTLAIDFRGHGDTTRESRPLDRSTFTPEDYLAMRKDVAAAMELLKSLPEVDAARIAIVGTDLGANVGLAYIAKYNMGRALCLLSPGFDYHGVRTEGPIGELNGVPVLIIAAKNDSYAASTAIGLQQSSPGNCVLKLLPKGGHGLAMLTAEPGLWEDILAWLKTKLPASSGK